MYTKITYFTVHTIYDSIYKIIFYFLSRIIFLYHIRSGVLLAMHITVSYSKVNKVRSLVATRAILECSAQITDIELKFLTE